MKTESFLLPSRLFCERASLAGFEIDKNCFHALNLVFKIK